MGVPGEVGAGEERRHPPGAGSLWAESWYFDFASDDGRTAGFVRLALYPHLGVAWYWAALVGAGRRLVLVKDHDLAPPRGRDLEIRGEGIWSAVNCETPLDHWSVGLEAFAVAFDDPLEAWRSERGDLVGLGFDLEWEATSAADRFRPCRPAAQELRSRREDRGGYWQPCRVTGEILVGEEQLDFDGIGCRTHAWGVQDWWSVPIRWLSGTAGDGSGFAVWRSGATDLAAGYAGWRPGAAGEATRCVAPHDRAAPELDVTVDTAGLPQRASAGSGSTRVEGHPLYHVPMVLDGPQATRSWLVQSLSRIEPGGGLGWLGVLAPTAPAGGMRAIVRPAKHVRGRT